MNAKKNTLRRDDAIALVRKANELYVAKGKKIMHIDLKNEKPGDDELARLLLGPTGNLRAPTLRKGKTIVVGFDEAIYQKVFA